MFRQAWELHSQRVSGVPSTQAPAQSTYQEAKAHARMDGSIRRWWRWGRHGIETGALGGGVRRVAHEGSHHLLFLYSQGGGSAPESNQSFLLKASLLFEPPLDLKPPPLSPQGLCLWDKVKPANGPAQGRGRASWGLS